MRTVLVNYASRAFEAYQTINEITGRRFGFDDCRRFGPADLPAPFVRAHEEVLSTPRGAGCWLWKPFIVQRALSDLEVGDLLFYSDAAVHFVSSISPMLALMDEQSLDVLVLGEGFLESEFTKRDAFVLMDCDEPRYAQSPQRFASYFLVRKCARTEEFFARYLEYACDPRILTDAPNVMGRPNYPGFIGHRHDQSIFSLLTKKLELPFVQTGFVASGLADRGEQILNHTRAHETPGRILQRLLAAGILSPKHLERFEI